MGREKAHSHTINDIELHWAQVGGEKLAGDDGLAAGQLIESGLDESIKRV